MLPDGIALINVWDIAINKTIFLLLAALQGHLYNNHMYLFLNLERDLEKLDEPPELSHVSLGEALRDGALLMPWRPRLHYVLRFCKMSEKISGKRRRVCTIFAKHTCSVTFNGDLQEKVEELEDKVQQAAKAIGVSHLLQEKIEAINLDGSSSTDDYSRCLYHKFQQVICGTPYEDIPLSWVFLRSLFYRSKRIFISKQELTDKAKQCGISDKSVKEFCEFYTSFGSIFDLSLVNPQYQYVVINPMGFLESMDKVLYPTEDMHQKYITLQYGIVPEEACNEVFKDNWPAFMESLVSINLAIKLSSSCIGEVPNYTFSRNQIYYYIPRSRNGPLIADPNTSSVHLITSINAPHVFNQTKFAKHLLQSLVQSKLLLCPNSNQTIIKDELTGTVITLVSHSPATRLHISKPCDDICLHIVEAYDEIAKSCTTGTMQYKFVKICARSNVKNVQSIPSCQYHVLPNDVLCEDCVQDGRKDDILLAWNKALKKVR